MIWIDHLIIGIEGNGLSISLFVDTFWERLNPKKYFVETERNLNQVSVQIQPARGVRSPKSKLTVTKNSQVTPNIVIRNMKEFFTVKVNHATH